MTGRGLVDAVPTAVPSTGGDRVLGLFLRALMGARRSLTLYPAESEIASTWVRRLHRSLGDFFQQGLCFPLRVERDRFVWAGRELRTADPVLEPFRFDLESRGIRELEIDAAVEEWELQAFLDLLNTPPDSELSAGLQVGSSTPCCKRSPMGSGPRLANGALITGSCTST